MTQPIQFTRGSGGKFTGSVGGVAMPPAMVALFQRLGAAAGGPMSFNGKTGTGYGMARGDARVSMLQTALNRLGITDGNGHKLQVDGQLGPLTTAAVKKAQQMLSQQPNGVVTPKLMAQILGMKPAAVAPKTTARHLMSRRRHH